MKFSRALVVDDYADVASITARSLLLLGIADQVEIASSGEEAWTMLASAPFDLVIADQRLPEMDGITLLDKILSEQPEVQCILMTGDDLSEVKLQARHSRIQHFVAKPFPVETLAALTYTLCQADRKIAADSR
jgi:CheY-like chemotaxis protein